MSAADVSSGSPPAQHPEDGPIFRPMDVDRDSRSTFTADQTPDAAIQELHSEPRPRLSRLPVHQQEATPKQEQEDTEQHQQLNRRDHYQHSPHDRQHRQQEMRDDTDQHVPAFRREQSNLHPEMPSQTRQDPAQRSYPTEESPPSLDRDRKIFDDHASTHENRRSLHHRMDIDDDVNTDIVDHNDREDERREATGNHKGLSGLVQEVVHRDVTRGIDMSSYREEREAEDQEESVEADQPRDNFGAEAGPNIKSEPDGVVSVHAHRPIAAATNTWLPDNTTTSTKSEAHSSQSQTRHAGSKHSAEGTSQEGLPSKALRTKRETIKKAPKVYPPRKPRARPVALEPVTMTIRTDSALSTLASAAVAIKNRQEDASILSVPPFSPTTQTPQSPALESTPEPSDPAATPALAPPPPPVRAGSRGPSKAHIPHDAGGYRCDLCPGERFGRVHDLKRHQISKHNEMTWPCDFCHRPFVRRDALLRHYSVKAARHDGVHPSALEEHRLQEAKARAKLLS